MSLQPFTRSAVRLLACIALAAAAAACGRGTDTSTPEAAAVITSAQQDSTVAALVRAHGDALRPRIERGVAQAARFWRSDDGDAAVFTAFCLEQFIADSTALDAFVARFEHNLMLISGHITELTRELNIPLHLDTGPLTPVDGLFGEFNPGVHVTSDLFATKLAFTVLLNLPLTSLTERLEQGAQWTRARWAEARLAGAVSARVPSEAYQRVTRAYTQADTYISEYNIHMHGVLGEGGGRLFPEGLALISHWGLRDELKAQYDKEGGLARQRAIRRVMDRIVAQEIPAAVINNPDVDWNPFTNAVTARGAGAAPSATPEADMRYRRWLDIFQAERGLDPYFPNEPSFIHRKFEREREIPEKEVEALLVSVLSAPQRSGIARLIEKRLGRPLEPFDIWYTGFRAKSPMNEDALDRIISARYPDVAAFQRDLPGILGRLGFPRDKARWLADRITVDASRGAGHAMGAGRLTDNARLRTRIPAGGMTYKGYNIAIHELGHNVEQTFSFQGIDRTLLRGVPNTAFTEGFAFVFQRRDLDILGVKASDPDAEALEALNVLWSTAEIAGVALLDMRTWRWMVEHPEATPAELRDAVLRISRELWNEYYAPMFGERDVTLLAIYSHLVSSGMYVPDYPLGHIIAFQIEEYLRTRPLAQEMERMCTIGSVSPDLWMRTAVGAPISTEPLLRAAAAALEKLR